MTLNRFFRPRSLAGSKRALRVLQSAIVSRPAVFESLEERKLMSLTISLETTSGSKTATVSSVGQVVSMEVIATVTGNTSGANDGFQELDGSFLGTATSPSSSVAGKLASLVTNDYTASGAQEGTSVDLNGDGNLDVGSNNGGDASGFFIARAGGLEQNGTVSGNSQSFEVGTLTYTVTNLHSGAATDINFRLRNGIPSGAYDAVWVQDGNPLNDSLASVSIGSPVVVSAAGVKAPSGSISGTITKSVSGKSSADASVTVYLDANKDGSLDDGEISTTTNSSGAYTFSGLAAGTYYVRQVVASGYTQTSPSSSPTTVTLSSSTSAVTGENFTDTASNVTTKTGSLAGTVFKVVNGSSSTFSGVTVYLDNNDDGKFDSGDTSATTSSSGTYSFGNLPAGTYHISEVVPSGYTQTSPTSVPDNVAVGSGQAVTGVNFVDTSASSTATGSISGTVYSDANGNSKLDSGEVGIANVTLYIDLKKDGKDDSGDPTATTSSSGAYTFSGLAAGTYRVRQVLLSGDKFTNPTSGYFDVTVGNGAKVTGENFGNTGPLSLSGTVFNDANSNGKQDSGEAGLSGFVVYVDLNKDGKFESSENNKTTASNGSYSFVSLKAGTYEIRVVAKSGYTLTSPSSGYYTVVLAPGDPITGISFAEHQSGASTSAGTPTGSVTLSGTVFDDANKNGTQNSTEAGLSGWVVYADLNDDGKFESNENNKTTDSNGNFEFVSLTAGTYTIRLVPKAGYTGTVPSSGFYTVTLAAGEPATTDFGEVA